MKENFLTVVRLQDVTGFAEFQSYSTIIIATGVSCWVGIEIYKLITQGQCELVSPVIRGSFAAMCVRHLSDIAERIYTLTQDLAQHFEQAAAHVPWEALKSKLFSDAPVLERATSGIISTALYTATLILPALRTFFEILVCDYLQAVLYHLIAFAGLIVLPLSAIPGMPGVGAWFRNLIEVALWPLIFQFLTLLSAMAGAGIVEVAGKLNVIDLARNMFDDSQQPIKILFQFVGLYATDILLAAFTPLIARTLLRGESVGVLGGIVTAKVLSAVQTIGGAMAGNVFGPGLARFTSFGEGSMGGVASSVVSKGFRVVADASQAADSVNLNQRRHAPPRAQEGGVS